MKKVIFILSLFLSSHAAAQSVVIDAPKIGSAEIAFSPQGGAQGLILKLIRSARSDIQMMAFSLTSKPIVDALVKAKRRGVDVAVAVDSSNTGVKTGQLSLSALVNAGVSVRTVSKFKEMNDKLLIVDGKHIEFGSYNYTKASNLSNSENVTVLWNAPDLVNVYFNHWQRRWQQGTDYKSVN